MWRTCPDCGQTFWADADYMKRCLDCYLARLEKRGLRRTQDNTADLRAELAETRQELERARKEVAYIREALTEWTTGPDLAELRAHLRRLIALCHPDKHAGSAAAHDETLWLLDLRQRLRA